MLLKITERHQKVINYFNTNGIDLTIENGKLLPIDKTTSKSHIYADKWSIDVIVLTDQGPNIAYFRRDENQFTINGIYPFDVPITHNIVNLLSNKYLLDTVSFNEWYKKM